MVDEVLLEKLRRVKAIADESKTDHECQTAMMMFQRLLAKHGLTTSEVTFEEKAEQIDTISIHSSARVEMWLRNLHCVIAKHFRCIPVSRGEYQGSGKNRIMTLQFIGHSADAEIAAEAFKTAKLCAERMYARRVRVALENEALGAPARKIERNKYYIGFGFGLEAAYKQQEAEATFDLIITTPSDVLEAVSSFKNVKHHFNAQRGNESVESGFMDGNNVGRGNALPAMDF